MRLRDHYATLLHQLDELESSLSAKNRLTTFDERETIAAAYNALNRATRERDLLVEVLRSTATSYPETDEGSDLAGQARDILRELGEAS